MDVHKMLEQVKAGQMDIAEAEEKLKDLPYEDLGYAKLGTITWETCVLGFG